MVRQALGVLALSLCGANAWAQKVEAFAGAEVWNANEVKGHGIAMVRGTYESPEQTLIAEINTDTLTIRSERTMETWSFGVQLRAEAFIAGLLTDYFVGGVHRPENAFTASYLEFRADAKTGAGHNWFHVSGTGRQWLFDANDGTAPGFALPPDVFVFEQRLGWTYWDIASDASFYDAHRVGRRRITGLGFGVELGADFRDEVGTWGVDGRNDPERIILTARQWSAAGVEWQPGWRLQVRQWAGAGWGEDDLTRARVGGMNPYVVPVPGLPWASFLASTYAVGEVSQAMRVGRDIEVGFTGNAAVVDDPHREGDFDTYGSLLGTSLFVDARLGDWQVNAAVGAAPDTGNLDVDLIVGAYVDAGTKF